MTYIKTTDFGLEVSKGNVSGTTNDNKFGYNADVDTGSTPEDIWGQGGIWVAPTTARLHNIKSSNVNDTSAGTGLRTVSITGLNASYVVTTETVTMNGTTDVATVNSYVIIHRMVGLTAGSGGTNAGTITATAQTDATITCSIEIGFGQSQFAILQIPAGYTAYITKVRSRMNQTTASSTAQCVLFIKPFGGIFNAKTNLGLNNSGSSSVEIDRTHSPIVVSEKSIIKITCISVSNNNTSIEASWDYYLVAN
jgi:hypothetical protein